MDRKMNFFRFCRWSLAALPVFLLFSACDKILPPSGNGVDIPVKIRAVSIAGGAQNETVTRASGQKRIVGEPIVQDLGGGVFAEITVEEDVSALRAGDTSLADKVKFRVIAVNSSDNKVYSYANYEVNETDKSMDRTSDEDLHVEIGKSYYFVCISYNNTTLPDPPEPDDDPTVEVTAGSNDLLYQTFTPTGTIPATGFDLVFKDLRHQLVKVKLKLDGNGKTITAIDGSKPISLDAPTSGDFDLKEGDSSNGDGSVVFTGWPGTINAETVTTNDEIRFLPRTAGDFMLTISTGAISWDGSAWPTVARAAFVPAGKFQKGGIYTLSVKRKELVASSTNFADSNIYWDGNELTFAENGKGSDTSKKYQGVYFKWGSLIGVSPVGDFSSGTTANQGKDDGMPIYLKVRENGAWIWKKTNVAYATATSQKWLDWWRAVPDNTSDSAAWNAIPYQNSTSISTTDRSAYSLLANPDFAAYKGDICNYINPAYRMPTSTELGNLGIGTYMTSTSSFSVGDSEDNRAGKYIFDENSDDKTIYGTFTTTDPTGSYVLPASGCRYGNRGLLSSVGYVGYYWSGSANSSSDAYELFFGSNGAYADGIASRSYGQPVRCVLN